MQRAAAALLSDSSGYADLGVAEKEVARLVEKSEEDEALLFSVILEYIRARREEAAFQNFPSQVPERKERVSLVLSLYLHFLRDILECIEKKEIEANKNIESAISRARSEHAGKPSREDKISMHRQILALHSEVKEDCQIESLLKFAALDASRRVHILREEARVIAELRPESTEEVEHRPLQVHKVLASSHPARISGSLLPQDINNLLHQKNGPSISIEEFGERIMRALEKETQNTVDAVNEEEPGEEENKTSEENEETQREKNIRRDEMADTVFRGEGNMHRRG